MAFSFDAPELDLEAESPAPRSEPAAESRRKPPQSKWGSDGLKKFKHPHGSHNKDITVEGSRKAKKKCGGS